jgi:hypothetical protein
MSFIKSIAMLQKNGVYNMNTQKILRLSCLIICLTHACACAGILDYILPWRLNWFGASVTTSTLSQEATKPKQVVTPKKSFFAQIFNIFSWRKEAEILNNKKDALKPSCEEHNRAVAEIMSDEIDEDINILNDYISSHEIDKKVIIPPFNPNLAKLDMDYLNIYIHQALKFKCYKLLEYIFNGVALDKMSYGVLNETHTESCSDWIKKTCISQDQQKLPYLVYLLFNVCSQNNKKLMPIAEKLANNIIKNKNLMGYKNENNKSAHILYDAIHQGNYSALSVLVKTKHFDLNNEFLGKTPLRSLLDGATTENQKEIISVIQSMIDFGADIDKPSAHYIDSSSTKVPLLTVALKRGLISLAEYLITQSKMRGSQECTPFLEMALEQPGYYAYHPEVVKALVKKGASFDDVKNNDWALIYGIVAGDISALETIYNKVNDVITLFKGRGGFCELQRLLLESDSADVLDFFHRKNIIIEEHPLIFLNNHDKYTSDLAKNYAERHPKVFNSKNKNGQNILQQIFLRESSWRSSYHLLMNDVMKHDIPTTDKTYIKENGIYLLLKEIFAGASVDNSLILLGANGCRFENPVVNDIDFVTRLVRSKRYSTLLALVLGMHDDDRKMVFSRKNIEKLQYILDDYKNIGDDYKERGSEVLHFYNNTKLVLDYASSFDKKKLRENHHIKSILVAQENLFTQYKREKRLREFPLKIKEIMPDFEIKIKDDY